MIYSDVIYIFFASCSLLAVEISSYIQANSSLFTLNENLVLSTLSRVPFTILHETRVEPI